MELEYINYTDNDKANVINLGWGGSWRSRFVQPEVLNSVMRAEIAISKLRNNNETMLYEVERLEHKTNTLGESYHNECLKNIELNNKLKNTDESFSRKLQELAEIKIKHKDLEDKYEWLTKESIIDKNQLSKLRTERLEHLDDLQELEVANEVHNRTIENYEKTVAKLEQEEEYIREDSNREIEVLQNNVEALEADVETWRNGSKLWENKYANLVAKLQLLLPTPS